MHWLLFSEDTMSDIERIEALEARIEDLERRLEGKTKKPSTFVCFELTMPSVNVWNGKWTGEGQLHAVVWNAGTSKKARQTAEDLVGSYEYDFNDGWAAKVTVSIVTRTKAADIRKRSDGFLSYEWMIDSIKRHKEIRVKEQ